MTLLMKGSPPLICPTARERCRASTLTPGISTGPEVHVDMYNYVMSLVSTYVGQDCNFNTYMFEPPWPLSAYLNSTVIHVHVSCHIKLNI